MEVDRWFQNHAPVVDTTENVVDTTENEVPWTLVTCKSRTPPQSPPSSITTENNYEALTAVDTNKQGLVSCIPGAKIRDVADRVP